MKHRDEPNNSCQQNVSYLCSYTKERRSDRKLRQELGHANAELLRQAGSNSGTVEIKRVGKNSRGEAVSCAQCTYSARFKRPPQPPERLYIVLTSPDHTTATGACAHGKVAGQHHHAGMHVVKKLVTTDMREFIKSLHQQGVPPVRILQGPCLAPQFRNTTLVKLDLSDLKGVCVACVSPWWDASPY